ncbi:MAG: helix-turn-helix transcriptional regulator [Clostridia bacterium]|nr:helix-turn-helix transcriptional regulator [Clostridia bacterium]
MQIVSAVEKDEVYSVACLVYKTTALNWQIHLYDPSRRDVKRITVHTAEKKSGVWLVTEPIDLTKYNNTYVERYNGGKHGLFAFDTNDNGALFYLRELAFFRTAEEAKKWEYDEYGIPHPICEHTSIMMDSEQSLEKNGMVYRHRPDPYKTGTWRFSNSEQAIEVAYTAEDYNLGSYNVEHWRAAPRFVSTKSDMLYRCQRHEHKFCEFIVVTAGSVQITCSSNTSERCKVFTLKRGELMFIPQNSFHLYRPIGNKPLEMVSLHFYVHGVDLKKLMTISLNHREIDLLHFLLKDMQDTYDKLKNVPPIEFTDTSKKLFEVFCEYVMRGNFQAVTQNTPSDSASKKSELHIYHSAVNYMNNNLQRKLGIKEVASACTTCKTTLTKVFHKYANMSCIRFFSALKMEHAQKMLSDGKSCAYVAEALGFSSQAYFSKCFKQHFGVVPSNIDLSKNKSLP